MRTFLHSPLVLALLLFSLSTGPAAGQAETFMVTVEKKTSEHPYHEEGDDDGYVIDGTQGKALKLEKDTAYAFEMGSSVGSFHPFYISTDPIGRGSGTYSQGVENNGATQGGTLTFTPPSEAPDSLWYQCQNHPKMGWRITLVEDSARAAVSGNGPVSFNDTGVTINFSGTSGSGPVVVDKFNSSPDGQDDISESHVSEYRFVIEADDNLRFDSNTEIRFDVGTLLGIGDPSKVRIYKRSTVGTGSFTSLSTDYDPDTNELSVTTGTLSEFVLASDSETLPVELAAFDAQLDGQAVELTWRTAAEQNNAGFEVQRRVQGATWTALGFVESKASGGTTAEPQHYRFRDGSLPFEATHVSYRLKQTDTDGTSRLSSATTVRLDTPGRVALRAPYPNPATGPAKIRYTLPRATQVQLTIYNLLGQRMATLVDRQQRAGRKEIRFETPGLPSGAYILRLTAGEQVRTRKLTILR